MSDYHINRGAPLWDVDTDLTDEQADLIRLLVEKLPPIYREAVEMRIWKSMKYTDIAKALGLNSKRNAHYRYWRGVEMVGKMIDDVVAGRMRLRHSNGEYIGDNKQSLQQKRLRKEWIVE